MLNDAIRRAADENVELIPAPYDEIYKAVGYEAFAVLFYYFGSQHVYIPSLRNVLSDAIKAQVEKECVRRVQSFEQIARKYGYTGRYLRKILNRK